MKRAHETMNQLGCERVISTIDIVAAVFYARLIEIDPELSFKITDNLFEHIRRLLTASRDQGVQRPLHSSALPGS
jgi:hypothetical protein